MLVPKKFGVEENFLPHLQENGYVVLKNVADEVMYLLFQFSNLREHF